MNYGTPAAQIIPKKQWRKFCKKFSESHKGWRVTVLDVPKKETTRSALEIRGADKHLVMNGLALERITADRDDAGLGLVIVAGKGPNRATHVICDPAKIRVEQTRSGLLKGLSFYSKDNQRTLVRFPMPVLS